ncbi:MAG: hypothetical protein GFH27_549281n93 [Chloroflexi bacterium AL-W]|nr:hypothetical protein [Chloroflexi bacterium AL-N1]NOK65979.1 hypothetical protein [Chloroflexi bacterium AL-N10]NOK72860.1 hypothetical protein [Chloroflexi bacterium AL-N5]NOK79757.1 hypothetical protein [Chloroflexi bacterium AL-W]NOK88387.1 hypothetical protein [Chloroflexi bacterium AL-N15]
MSTSEASSLGRIRRSSIHTVLLALPQPLIIATVLILITLGLLALGTRMANPHLFFTAGDGVDQRSLVRFHGLEQNDTEQFRWSQPDGMLFLYGFDGRPAQLELRMVGTREPGAEPAVLRPSVAGYELNPIYVTSEWRNYTLIVPTNPTSDTAVQLNSNVYQPEGDRRILGVAVSSVDVQMLGTRGFLPPLPRTLFLLSWPLVTWLLLWRLGVDTRIAVSVGIALAGVTGLAAVYPLTSGYIFPTIWWPWWPLMPLPLLAFAPTIFRTTHTMLAALQPYARLLFWGGLTIMAVALVALPHIDNLTLGMVGLLGGTVVTLAGIYNVFHTHQCNNLTKAILDSTVPRRFEIGAVALLTALAIGLRLYQLDVLPLGLWRDEARHGLLALRIWEDPTFRPIYVVTGADLPALLFYLMAPIIGIFGPDPGNVRMVSALLGALTPLALWWAARPIVGPRAALLGAALLTWSSWSLSMSRWGFPATLDQVLLLTAVGIIWRVADRIESASEDQSKVRFKIVAGAMLSGLCAALSVYAYHSGRMAPLIMVVLTTLRLGSSLVLWRRAIPALVAAIVVGLVTLAPILAFIADDYDDYNRRVAYVSVVNSSDPTMHAPLLLVWQNTQHYLLMWHVRGDANGRHHAPEAPMLDPIAGACLLLGIGMALLRWPHRSTHIILIWITLGLIPGIFSIEAPHAMRSLGALAPACILTGLGMTTILQVIQTTSAPHRIALFVISCMLIVSLAGNTWLYFWQMARDPLVYNEFDIATTTMARIARLPFETSDPALRNIQVYLPAELDQKDIKRLLTSGIPTEAFSRNQLSTPPGEQALILLPADAPPERREAALAALGPDAVQIDAVPHYPHSDQPIFIAYGVGDQAHRLITEMNPTK